VWLGGVERRNDALHAKDIQDAHSIGDGMIATYERGIKLSLDDDYFRILSLDIM